MLSIAQMQSPHYDLVPKDLDANIRFRKEVLRDAQNDMGAAAQYKQMCSEDCLFYINTFCFTSDTRMLKRGLPSRLPFVTYGFQDEAIQELGNCILTGQDVTVSKSRDMGASWINLTVIEWFWHFYEELSFLLTSRTREYVDQTGNPKSLFWKIDYLHSNQPRWLLPGIDRVSMHFGNEDNGSVIDGESTTGNIGVGDRRTALLVDEFGAFASDEGFAVLRGTRDVTDCRIFNSTPRGQNAFYEVVHNTSAFNIRMHWSCHPEKARGLYQTGDDGRVHLMDNFRGNVLQTAKGERAEVVVYPEGYRFRLDGKLRSPWYDAQCDRCASEREVAQELDIDFLGSDYLFFDAQTIDIFIKKYAYAPEVIGDLEYDEATKEPKRFTENPRGKLKLWMQLDRHGRVPPGGKYIVGSDVSAGTGASNSASSVVDEVTGEKVGVWIDSNTPPNPFASQTIALAKFFNRGLMIWDGSGPTGETFKKCVIESGYDNIYFRRNEDKIGQPITDKPGYFLTQTSRTALLQDYRHHLSQLTIINHSIDSYKECLQFIHKSDGNVEHRKSVNAVDPSGARTAHGDEVIADALTCQVLVEHRGSIQKSKEPEIPIGSLAWRRQRMENEQSHQMEDSLSEAWG